MAGWLGCFFVCRDVCILMLPVEVLVCLIVYWFVGLLVCWFACLPVCLFGCVFVCLVVCECCLFVCLVCIFVCLLRCLKSLNWCASSRVQDRKASSRVQDLRVECEQHSDWLSWKVSRESARRVFPYIYSMKSKHPETVLHEVQASGGLDVGMPKHREAWMFEKIQTLDAFGFSKI